MYAPNSLDAFWMPFTDNRFFRTQPRLFSRADGMHYYTPEGRAVLDGTAGLWCVNAGHNRRPIVEAIQRQAAELDFAPTFQLGHPLAFELASRLAAIMPEGLDRIVFGNSGSEAVDSALKIALAYQRAIGQGGRTRLIGRERGYHGVGFGGISVGGIVGNRRAFGSLLPGVDHLRHTAAEGHVPFTRGQPAAGADLADDLERIVALHGAETIAAVIVEPLAGSTGVLVPPTGYLQRLREITRRHGIMLIFDEVITAFGRLGAATAAERFGVIPDMICMAKALSNAAVPMSAVAVSGAVQDAVLSAAPSGVELAHGYTYSGHPLACAAALATLELFRSEDLCARSAAMEHTFGDAMHGLRDAAHVVDVRSLGLVAGIELAPRPEAPGARALEVFRACFDAGVLIRVTGETIALSPPLIAEPEHLAKLTDVIREVLSGTA